MARSGRVSVKVKDDKSLKDDVCPKCDITVCDKDMALECEICEKWFHIKCQSLTEAEYKFIGEHKAVHWYCTSCNKNVATFLQMLGNVKQRQDKLEENFETLKTDMSQIASDTKATQEVSLSNSKALDEMAKGNLPEGMMKAIEKRIDYVATKIKAEIGNLSQEVKTVKDLSATTETKLETAIEAKLVEGLAKSIDSQVENKMKSQKQQLELTFADVVSKQVNSKMGELSGDLNKVQQVLGETKKQVEEEKDKENRSNNIIIYRIPESTTREQRKSHDTSFCMELFKDCLDVDIVENDLKAVFRIGKVEQDLQTPRPLLIQCKERGVKNRIMESLSKLRNADSKFKSLSITHDLTQKERSEMKTLLEEAKQKQLNETGEFMYRVRGSPGQMKVVRLRKH